MAVSPHTTAAGTRPTPWIDRPAGAPVVLFLLTLAIYLTTLTHVHTFDALSYVTSVERKPWTELFHPHHLAYGPLGVLGLYAGQSLGYTSGAALPISRPCIFGHWRNRKLQTAPITTSNTTRMDLLDCPSA